METFLLNLLKTSLLGSLAIAAMLALKPLWRERYRAKTRCWLWLALAVFLLLPVDFSVKNAPVQAEPPKDYTLFVGTEKTTIMSTDNLFGDMAEKSGQSPAQVRDTIIHRPVTNPEQKTTRYIPVTTILFYGYLAGAAAFLLYQGGSYARFRRTVRRWKRDVARADYAFLLYDAARELGVNAPEMIVCEAISTPAVTGLLRPRLLLPHERYDVQELRYILRHELCHLKRRDMLLKLVLLAANAMHWFNPVVYLMLRQADEDIELACDSAATDGLELPERAAYSRTLLAAVQSSVRALPATTCFGGTVERLKRRITNVLGTQKKRGLGIVAFVLALTLTAGCAVSWGERAQANDPFDGTTFSVDEAVYLAAEARNAVRGFPYTPATTFRALTVDSEKRVTMFAPSGDEFLFSPMEVVSLDKSTFPALFNDSADESWNGTSADELISGNQTVWKGSVSDATYEDYYNVLYLFAQKDGSFYAGLAYQTLGSDSPIKAIEGIGSVYRLIVENTDTIYGSMDDYAAARVEQLKQGTMEYYVRANNTGVVKDTVADVRVTQLEQGDSLGNLSPDGTVLELWYFEYEMKPTNEAGYTIEPVGGQELTDDGYLNEHWTRYLTVLHYTSGEKTGYQLIGTYTGNDGLWYDGCSYSEEPKHYLHDFYIDYAGLDLPRYQIGALYHFTDGYGNDLTADGRVQSGDGWYFYLPNTGAWNASLEEPLWESAYGTKSTFVVKTFSTDAFDAADYFKRDGWNVEDVDGQSVYTKTNGDQHARIRLYDRTDGGHYEVQTFWYDGQSTQENQWGWSAARQTAGERDLLEQMVKTFTVSGAMRKTYTPSFSADTELASNGGAAWMYLSEDGTAISDRDMKDVAPTVRLEACDYTAHTQFDPSSLSSFVPPRTGKVLELWLSNNDASHFAFYEGSNVMLYQCDEVRYYDVSNFGDYATLYDAMLAWFNSAQSGTETSDASSATTANAVSRDSLIKSADSYVDLGGYLWYTAGGKFYRWREGGSIETIDTLPTDLYLNDAPVSASLSTQGNRILMSYHIGGAIMGSFITDLYDTDGKKLSSINGYNAIAISGDIIVMTDYFMPTPNNLSISYDCGRTFTKFGDKDWFYGSALTEDGTYVTSVNSSLEIRDGYVYTTAVYDINHEKSDDPLVTHAVRISIKTGAQEILD